MFDFERLQRPALVAAKADERHQRADIGAAATQGFGLAGRIEILALDANDRLRRAGHRSQPPVIGGKKAISFAPAMRASWATWARSSAARMTLFFSKACA